MSFGLGVLIYILGSILLAVCIVAIPGRSGEAHAEAPHGHDPHAH
jgi:hypothetical protein